MKGSSVLTLLVFALPASAVDFPIVEKVEAQPLLAQAKRIGQALDALGQPLQKEAKDALAALKESDGDEAVAAAVQKHLDPFCLAAVQVAEGNKITVTPVVGKVELVEQGWRSFLVKVVNGSGTTGSLNVSSPSAKPVPKSPKEEIDALWLSLTPFTGQPLLPKLSGLGLEYTVVQLYSRDKGDQSAELTFSIEGDKKLSGQSGSAKWAFTAKPSIPVTFKVAEFDGTPATAAFKITDSAGRVYPAQSKRLAPDFFFHPQIYRATGETVLLPAGTYTVVCSRGPESIPETKTLTVTDKPTEFRYTVQRWIDPTARGWWSGDHHIHAAGCAHYEKPTEGVQPSDMMRHILGEDLKVGCCLTWGPCFDYQKRFFTGKPDDVSKYPYLLRYDVEVSGFGSHQSGHLNLLRLKEQMYPGGESKDHWPTLGMNTLRWAKKQGAVCGPAHSANGLTRFTDDKVAGAVDGPNNLPTFRIPAYDGIGANEFVVQAALKVPGPDGKDVPALDFISTMDTDRTAEFNMWYHVLNCGFRVRASGETDFPCISGERVGMGRVYVKQDGKLDFDKWVQGIADGRSYVSDGLTHLMDLTATADGKKYDLGVNGSEIKLAKAGKVTLTVQAAARYPKTQTIPVELIVNGLPMAKQDLKCDGKIHELTFDADLTQSSWVAVRAFPGGHTNPFFVLVGDQPIRASKHSAEWCLKGIDQCWKMKQQTYKQAEQKQAEADYDAARKVYQQILKECER
jgi:hypothetical protein